jgi:flagellar hook-length control protein FliK
MNPNSTALSNLSNVSLRASGPAGNASTASASATPGTPAATGPTEFSRMLASNQASARQTSARQNNAVNQGKFTVAPKTPEAPAQPSVSQGKAKTNANASEHASEKAHEPKATNDAAEPSATQTTVRGERNDTRSADAHAKAHDESPSAEASDAQDAEPTETAQTVSSDAAALPVPVALYVPPTVSLAQAPQLPTANIAATDDGSAALQATTAAALSTQTLTQPAPAAATPNDPALAQAAVSAQPAMVAAGSAAPATVNGKPAESTKSTESTDRDGRDVSASSGLQAMLGEAFNPVSQTQAQAQPKVDTGAAAVTSVSPSTAPQDTSRQDFSTPVPTGLPLAASSAAAAREAAAAEASLAVLGRSALNETRSRTPAAFDAAQSGVFALPTAGAATAAAARGSEMPAPLQANVPTPFAAPGFQQALGYQVSLLARDGIGQAELHLNPADMGPVSVQITMTGDQARVDFGADLAQTRQALEAGWAELASSLKDAGFTLSGGGVSDHARERQAPQGQAASQSFGSRADRDSGEAEVPNVAPVVSRRVNGAVDVYA